MEGAMAATLAGGITGPYTRYLNEHGCLEQWFADNRIRWDKGWIIGASHDSLLPLHLHQDSFVGDVAADRILNIEGDYPWYMLVSFQSPHDPYDPPTELAKKYRHVDVPEAIPVSMTSKPKRIQDRYARLYNHASQRDIQLVRQQYCATIELIDIQVGKLCDALEKRDMLQNTIIVFVSDHGDHVGDHGLFIKHTAYEPSMRVPLIIAGPGIARHCSDALVELIDIHPTLCDLADLPLIPNIDGQSFAQVIRQQQSEHRETCFTCEYGYRAIRTKQFKYIQTENDLDELYDLNTDPDECINLADVQSNLRKTLQCQLQQRLTQGQWRH
jgi:choline-sulfatase